MMFECELKQAFIMWPQPWSPWCWERGPATDSHGLLAGADAFPSAMSLSPFSLPLPLIPFSTLLLASNPAFPLSFLSSAILPPQSLYLSLLFLLHQCLSDFSYSSFTTGSLISLFPRIFPIILHEGQLLNRSV